MTTPAQHQPSPLELERRAYRKQQTAKSVAIALVSTVVFAVVVWFTVINSPGWERVQAQFFDWDTAVKSLPRVWDGFLLNLRVLAISAVCILIVALAIALIRTLKGPVFFPLRALVTVYTDIFRGIPVIIVLYLVGFGIPGLRLTDGKIPVEVLAVAGLTLTYSAYVSEVFRAGIEAVHPSQRQAARRPRAQPRQGDASRRRAAGDSQGGPAPHERFCEFAKRRRPHLGARRRRCRARRTD